MYLYDAKNKEKRRVFEYKLDGGLTNKSSDVSKIISMNNILNDNNGYISPREPFYVWDTENTLSSLGVINKKVYYASENKFYFDNKEIGYVSYARKQFINFKNNVLIFPDNKYYDTENNTFSTLQRSLNCKVNFILTDLGVNAIVSADSAVNLASTFKGGEGILIKSSTGNSQIDGYHYITGVDKSLGRLYFKNYEFGSSAISSCSCIIYNEVPKMSATALIGNRVFGVYKNKIYASKEGMPDTFCAFVGNDGSFLYECPYEENFTYCMEYKGYPLIFSSSAIYRIYGDGRDNFKLECVCGGGVDASDILSIAEIDGDVYYMSHGFLRRFSGGKSYKIDNIPYVGLIGAAGGECNGKYYLSAYDKNYVNRFFVYDTSSMSWYENSSLMISFFVKIDTKLYGISYSNAYLIGGYDEYVDGDGEGLIESYIELDDVWSNVDEIYPSRVLLRCYLQNGTNLKLEISYDGGKYERISDVSGEKYGMLTFNIPPKKCRICRLKIYGKGYFILKNLYLECIIA